uniref:Reverse transcriptase domain-containing protein n=1 Tax=Lepisosteus oculatus TaxID=7918 RepID=W5MWL4_LEPOC
WVTNNDLILTSDAKQLWTFHLARWQKDNSSDLCWVTTIANHPQPVSQTVLDNLSHSQHRPLLIHVGLQLLLIHSSTKKHWNFCKADRELYSTATHWNESRCIPIEEPHQHFQRAIFKAASVSIPRGCRPVFTPCLNEECKALLEEYEASGDPVIAYHLIESLDYARLSHLEENNKKLNFTHYRQKCWSLIRQLRGAQKSTVQAQSAVSPNAVASHLLQMAKGTPTSRQVKCETSDGSTAAKRQPRGIQGIRAQLGVMQRNILPEFLKHLRPKAKIWLITFYTKIMQEKKIPVVLHQANVIAIPKPGKDTNRTASYCPVSLLSVCFKLLECLILQRINLVLENSIIVDQSVATLGSQNSLTFPPRQKILDSHGQQMQLLEKMSERTCSVLSPSLFNVYINDLPVTKSHKFIYADDICLRTQGHTFNDVECVLNKDKETMVEYLTRWLLQQCVTKTVSSVFHLHSAKANQELNIYFKGGRIKHNPSVYLGVTLDRSLIYHEHLNMTAAKVSTQNNLLSKLAVGVQGLRHST